MSYTTLYKMGKETLEICDVRNGHRSAMYVWHQIAKDYFGQEHFPMFDQKLAGKIWNAHDHASLSDFEIIVLKSTMDKAVIDSKGVARLIEAFEAYGSVHSDSSFLEQAEQLKSVNLREGEFVGWQQTSCGEFWGETGYNEETEETIYYDPNSGDIHFDIIQEFDEFKSK